MNHPISCYHMKLLTKLNLWFYYRILTVYVAVDTILHVIPNLTGHQFIKKWWLILLSFSKSDVMRLWNLAIRLKCDAMQKDEAFLENYKRRAIILHVHNNAWRKNTNKMQQYRWFIVNSRCWLLTTVSTCFGYLYAHHQEKRPRVTAYGF